MTARSVPYPPPGCRIRVPEALWAAALEEVRHYATLRAGPERSRSEGLVYLAGVAIADELIVTSVLRLHHAPQGDRVQPTLAEVRWLLSTLRDRDEKLIAQLHTHRHGAAHSSGDDRMATSFHEGFLSIVAPKFARGIHRIDQCVVHEYRNGSFQPLSYAESVTRFRVHAQIVDRHTVASEGPTRWRRFVKRLKSIARRRR